MYEGELKKILKFQLLTGVQFTVSAASIASVQRYPPWDSHAFVLRVGLAAAQNPPTHHSAPCKSQKKPLMEPKSCSSWAGGDGGSYKGKQRGLITVRSLQSH